MLSGSLPGGIFHLSVARSRRYYDILQRYAYRIETVGSGALLTEYTSVSRDPNEECWRSIESCSRSYFHDCMLMLPAPMHMQRRYKVICPGPWSWHHVDGGQMRARESC